jgi:hypothetical protein
MLAALPVVSGTSCGVVFHSNTAQDDTGSATD